MARSADHRRRANYGRTSTAQWKKIRAKELRRAQRAGLTHCRYCGLALDYQQSLTPQSAEVDHVDGWANQGDNGNYQVICRRCNQSKGGGRGPKETSVLLVKPLATSRKW